MAKCPACGKEVETPIKEWDMGKNKKIHVKQYECCGKTRARYLLRKFEYYWGGTVTSVVDGEGHRNVTRYDQ